MELTGTISMDTDEAAERAAELAAHYQLLTDEERGYLTGYQALAAGMTLIRLPETLRAGGCFDDARALPRLAVARTHDRWSYVDRRRNGRVTYSNTQARTRAALSLTVHGFPTSIEETWYNYRAMVPPVPLGIRLRLGRRGGGGWRNCLILFEVAEWAQAPRPPGDPALLRHVGGDLYAVVAEWDLTELEQAVLATHRIN